MDEYTRLNFLYPAVEEGESRSIPLVEDQNGYSVVFTMTMYNSTFLFTGDMDAAAEQEVLAKLMGGVEAEEEEEIETVDVQKLLTMAAKVQLLNPGLACGSRELRLSL